jgi:hypothetical protein
MNAQEIFDTVARHLFAQGHRATDPFTGYCKYRAPNGDKCALGALIPDDLYVSDWDDNSEPALVEEVAQAIGLLKHVDLLIDLQSAHDAPSHWLTEQRLKQALVTVAEDHDLDTLVLADLAFS